MIKVYNSITGAYEPEPLRNSSTLQQRVERLEKEVLRLSKIVTQLHIKAYLNA